MTRPPVALTIAGSDPSGGAGIQADLKTFSALGAYGTAVLTALTAQSTQGVTDVHLVPPAFVHAQLETLVADVRLDAVKIGMLADAALVEVVQAFVRTHRPAQVVLDPVMVSTAGSRLLAEDAVDAVRGLVPHVGLITPNLAEAAVLLADDQATDVGGMRAQAQDLVSVLGARRVLLKGGHLPGEEAHDVWVDEDGPRVLTTPRVRTRHTHGTGCSLSSAVAALLPASGTWVDAAARAKTWLHGALAAGDRLEIGHGPGPVHHFYDLWRTA